MNETRATDKPKNKKLGNEQKIIHDLSERIVLAQKPMRILDAIKWDSQIQAQFFKTKCKELPKVNTAYYEKCPLPFEPEVKREEFYRIEHDIKRSLGWYSDVGRIMLRMCREYRIVIRLLEQRGKAEFGRITRELFGSSDEVFYAGAPTVRDIAESLKETLQQQQEIIHAEHESRTITAKEAVDMLQKRLSDYFNGSSRKIRVMISDGILADAAAGADTLKLRADAMFSERDIRLLEVHEGWVHIGTTLNGLVQPTCTFLSKGPPSSTITQEGLAIFSEMFTLTSSPARVLKLSNRVKAISMVEEGANFIDVYQFYLEQGLSEESAYTNSTRSFRGSLPDGLPFTKDLSYTKGFVTIYNYLRLAIRHGAHDQIPLLFLGKTAIEDLPVYAHLIEDGTIIPPQYIPPPFKDLSALAVWMTYSLSFNQMSLSRLSQDYRKFFNWR